MLQLVRWVDLLEAQYLKGSESRQDVSEASGAVVADLILTAAQSVDRADDQGDQACSGRGRDQRMKARSAP